MPLIITAEEVSAVLALSLNDADVQQAQDVLETVTGADLTGPDPASRFSADDLRRLRLAVQWQTGYLAANPTVLTQQAGISSVATNGSSISFDAAVQSGFLSPLAERVLRGLSWVRAGVTIQTLRPAPRTDYEPRPDPWQRVS